MNRFSTCLAGFACLAALAAVPVRALSWDQTMTDSGLPVSWDGSCFYYSINSLGSDDLPFEELEQLARSSFDVWEDVPCSYFRFVQTEATPVDEAVFNQNRPNVNLLVWRESSGSWSHGSTVVALTSVNYDNNTGDILDADIEFNGVDCVFANLDDYSDDTELVDTMNTMVHEIGHTIGLNHSSFSDATMYEWDNPGSIIKRDLSQDDIDGLCSIYPLEEDPEVCEEPYCGLGIDPSDTACRNNGDDGRCSVSATGSLKNMNLVETLLAICSF